MPGGEHRDGSPNAGRCASSGTPCRDGGQGRGRVGHAIFASSSTNWRTMRESLPGRAVERGSNTQRTPAARQAWAMAASASPIGPSLGRRGGVANASQDVAPRSARVRKHSVRMPGVWRARDRSNSRGSMRDRCPRGTKGSRGTHHEAEFVAARGASNADPRDHRTCTSGRRAGSTAQSIHVARRSTREESLNMTAEAWSVSPSNGSETLLDGIADAALVRSARRSNEASHTPSSFRERSIWGGCGRGGLRIPTRCPWQESQERLLGQRLDVQAIPGFLQESTQNPGRRAAREHDRSPP